MDPFNSFGKPKNTCLTSRRVKFKTVCLLSKKLSVCRCLPKCTNKTMQIEGEFLSMNTISEDRSQTKKEVNCNNLLSTEK